MCMNLFCGVLRNNKTLEHLDISYCNFGEEDCAELAAALATNHTLVGLHFGGSCVKKILPYLAEHWRTTD